MLSVSTPPGRTYSRVDDDDDDDDDAWEKVRPPMGNGHRTTSRARCASAMDTARDIPRRAAVPSSARAVSSRDTRREGARARVWELQLFSLSTTTGNPFLHKNNE